MQSRPGKLLKEMVRKDWRSRCCKLRLIYRIDDEGYRLEVNPAACPHVPVTASVGKLAGKMPIIQCPLSKTTHGIMTELTEH